MMVLYCRLQIKRHHEKTVTGNFSLLFGILLALFALVNPWIPIIDDLLGTISGYASIICGIIGVILALKKD